MSPSDKGHHIRRRISLGLLVSNVDGLQYDLQEEIASKANAEAEEVVIAAGEEYLLNVKYARIDEYGRSVLSADSAAETDDVLGGGTEIEVGVEVVAYDVLMKGAAAFVAHLQDGSQWH